MNRAVPCSPHHDEVQELGFNITMSMQRSSLIPVSIKGSETLFFAAETFITFQEVKLRSGIPTVVSGPNHSITHIHNGSYLAVPFETPSGQFTVKIAFNNQ